MTFLDLIEITRASENRYNWYLKGSVYQNSIDDPASCYLSSYYKEWVAVQSFLHTNFDKFQINKIMFIYETSYYCICLIKSKNELFKVVRMSKTMFNKIMKDFVI